MDKGLALHSTGDPRPPNPELAAWKTSVDSELQTLRAVLSQWAQLLPRRYRIAEVRPCAPIG